MNKGSPTTTNSETTMTIDEENVPNRSRPHSSRSTGSYDFTTGINISPHHDHDPIASSPSKPVKTTLRNRILRKPRRFRNRMPFKNNTSTQKTKDSRSKYNNSHNNTSHNNNNNNLKSDNNNNNNNNTTSPRKKKSKNNSLQKTSHYPNEHTHPTAPGFQSLDLAPDISHDNSRRNRRKGRGARAKSKVRRLLKRTRPGHYHYRRHADDPSFGGKTTRALLDDNNERDPLPEEGSPPYFSRWEETKSEGDVDDNVSSSTMNHTDRNDDEYDNDDNDDDEYDDDDGYNDNDENDEYYHQGPQEDHENNNNNDNTRKRSSPVSPDRHEESTHFGRERTTDYTRRRHSFNPARSQQYQHHHSHRLYNTETIPNDENDNNTLIMNNNNNNDKNNNKNKKDNDHGLNEYMEETERRLIEAVEDGDTEVAEAMLQDDDLGIDINTGDAVQDAAPLHRAAGNGHVDMMKLLLHLGADIMKTTRLGETPLHWAAAAGTSDGVGVLCSWYHHISNNNNNTTTTMNGGGEDGLVNARDIYGYTALQVALKGKYITTAETLVLFGASTTLKTLSDGSSPLHLCAQNGDMAGIRFLERHGAAMNARDTRGETPLMRAAKHGQIEVFEKLLQAEQGRGLSLNEKGESLVHLAVIHGYPEVIHTLARRMPERCLQLINEADRVYGRTPLHMAVLRGRQRIANDLLLNGSRIDVQDRHGNTPLHLALERNDSAMARKLFGGDSAKQKRRLLDLKNHRQYSPLDLAKQRGIDCELFVF